MPQSEMAGGGKRKRGRSASLAESSQGSRAESNLIGSYKLILGSTSHNAISKGDTVDIGPTEFIHKAGIFYNGQGVCLGSRGHLVQGELTPKGGQPAFPALYFLLLSTQKPTWTVIHK